jgi:hypothetical protein
LTELQKEVVQAFIGQGYKEKDARSMVKAAEGDDFDTLFRSALPHQTGKPIAPIRDHEAKLDDTESGGPLPPVADAEVESSIAGGEESTPTIPADPQIAAENAATPVLDAEVSAFTTASGTLSPTQTPENVLTPPTATYADWEGHRLPAPEFKRRYFAAASEDFKNRYHYAFQRAAFQKLLTMLKNKPDQVLANAQDFEHLVAVLRGAAENANLLAAVIATALAPSPGPAREESKPRRHDAFTDKSEETEPKLDPEVVPSTAAEPTPTKTPEEL